MLPDTPEIKEDDLRRCRETGDFSPVIFEWYKYVGGLCVTFSNLLQSSPSVRKDITNRDYGIFIGLINRCARLIRANLALSQEGVFGETTSILDRCIFESCVIINWLCKTTIEDKFERFIASGLKTELELKFELQKSIDKRDGLVSNIDKRMLNSIRDCFIEAGIDEEKIINTKCLPDIASMLTAIGHPRLSYTVGQRVGSHFVHGTWIGLRYHYIELGDNSVYRTKQVSETHINQYVYISYIVLETLSSFVRYIFVQDEDETEEILKLFENTAEEIDKLNKEIIGTDFEPVEIES